MLLAKPLYYVSKTKDKRIGIMTIIGSFTFHHT